MNINICKCERLIRIIVGIVLTSMAFWGPHSLWFLFGLFPVVTGTIGFCPAYGRLGIDTAKRCSASCCCCKAKEPPKA